VSAFELTALFISLVAVGGWVNARTFHLPHAVAMLLVGLAGAGVVFGLDAVRPDLAGGLIKAVASIDFAQAVLGYMLAFLLFAGAMQVDLAELRRRRLEVLGLATLGVLASTAIVGVGVWLVAGLLGVALPLTWALVFGALISPTDPIAVLATVRRGDLSKTLQVILQGEALFNDGVGIVVFTALLAFAAGSGADPMHALGGVFVEAVGGLALGAVASLLVIRAMRAVDDFVVEVTLSVALAMAVYAGAQALHLSGPIAVVGAGLLIGDRNAPGTGVVSAETEAHLRTFWTLVDEILNALLFFLLGLELLVLPLEPRLIGLSVAAIVLVLLTRFVVVLPWGSYLLLRHEERGANVILAWGGLHGALSLALALSVPPGPHRATLLVVTYAVAAFSVAVQGLTFTPLAAHLRRRSPAAARDD
jgi:CPA1 family monovalent cation:H+ antiporter